VKTRYYRMSIIAALAMVGVIASRSPAWAQPAMTAPAVTGGDDKPWNRGVPRERREAARAMFLEGNRLFHVPLFARAAEQYTAALAIWKHPVFSFNLAQAQLYLGQDVEAHDSLEQALRYGDEALGPAELREARKQIQELERQLGRIRVTCSTVGAEVTLDGAPLFVGPGRHEGWVKAKAHEVTAKKLDYLSEARRVTVRAGEREELELALITLGEATHTTRRWAAWKPWVVVVAGGAVVASAGVMHAFSARSFKDYDARFLLLDCVARVGSIGCAKDEVPPSLTVQLDRATRQQQMAVAGYIVGGSAIATGAVLLYLNRSRRVEGLASGARNTVAIVPAVSADMLGVVVHVSH
jgi:tetratricopeptide (TPR) repeat protein